MFFFFFKQKTAYELRISDWGSDVCSSDLLDIFQAEIPKATLARIPCRPRPPSRNNNPNRRLLTEPPSRSWLAKFRETGFLSGLSWVAVRFLSLTHFVLDVLKGNFAGIRLSPILPLIKPNPFASRKFTPTFPNGCFKQPQ